MGDFYIKKPPVETEGFFIILGICAPTLKYYYVTTLYVPRLSKRTRSPRKSPRYMRFFNLGKLKKSPFPQANVFKHNERYRNLFISFALRKTCLLSADIFPDL
jgi:hypothetical protein